MAAGNTMRSRIPAGLLVCLSLGILLATLTPGGMHPPVPGGDKSHHVIGFAALTLPVVALRPGWALAVLIYAICLGGLIELVQPLVGRSRELADWWADIAGALGGVALGLLAAALWRIRHRPGR